MVSSANMSYLYDMVSSMNMSYLSDMVTGSYMSDFSTMANSSGMTYLSSMVSSANMYDLSNFTGEISMSMSGGPISFSPNGSNTFGFNRTGTSVGVLQVGDNSMNGNGAYLSSGGTWTNASSIDLKTNFIGLTNEWIFNKIKSINVSKWTYKDTDEVHIGPTSEEFAKAFNTGAGSDKFISTIDVSGVALRGVQGLIDRDESQAEEINELKSEIEELKEQIELLKSLIE